MNDVALKNPAELPARLDLRAADRVLLVDPPESLRTMIDADRPPDRPAQTVASRSIRSVKTRFDAILVWREDRVGSRSVFDEVVKRLEGSAVLWVVVAMKKVMGPVTPAAHRLDLFDLEKAFAGSGLARDREVRVSAWHVGYRFVRET